MVAQVKSKYEARDGKIHLIKLTPAYAAVAGTVPTADVDSRIKVKVSKGNREHGLRPRGVTLARTVGTAPDTFVKYTFLPLRSIADETKAEYQLGKKITIDSVEWEVVAFVPEDY